MWDKAILGSLFISNASRFADRYHNVDYENALIMEPGNARVEMCLKEAKRRILARNEEERETISR